MSAWSRSADGHAATAQIKIEITRQGWDQLSKSSPKNELNAGEAQRLQFIQEHLTSAYPKACKDTQAWRQFIKTITAKVRQCGSTSVAYQQHQNKTHNTTRNDAVRKRNSGKLLSDDALKAQDLVLTDLEEHHVKRQVNVVCVCTRVRLCCRCACDPQSVHVLAHPSLTDVFCLLSIKKNNDSSNKAAQKAWRKSKSNEVLTDEDSVLVARYSHRYSHPIPCVV